MPDPIPAPTPAPAPAPIPTDPDPFPPSGPAPDLAQPQAQAPLTGRAKQRAQGHHGIKGGARGGCPPGSQHRDVAKIEIEAADAIAARILAGKSAIRLPSGLGPVTEEDRKRITRITGMAADDFQAHLTAKLRHIVDMTADRIEQALDEGRFKPHELSFLLTVGVDKLQRTEGRAQINSAQVNVQINNFGSESKEAIIARLSGQSLPEPEPQPGHAAGTAPAPAPAVIDAVAVPVPVPDQDSVAGLDPDPAQDPDQLRP